MGVKIYLLEFNEHNSIRLLFIRIQLRGAVLKGKQGFYKKKGFKAKDI